MPVSLFSMTSRLVLSLALLSMPVLATAQAASVNLAWDYTQGTTKASLFRIYRQGAKCTGPFTQVGTAPMGSQAYSDATVAAGEIYCWYVTAQAATGEESAHSNAVRFQVPAPPGTPEAPTHLRGTMTPLQGMRHVK